jgi:hypothetical protein
MKCPKCEKQLHCPCKNCIDVNLKKMNWDTENFLQWYYDEECLYCGNCGYLQHADFWFEIECKEHENILEDEERDGN